MYSISFGIFVPSSDCLKLRLIVLILTAILWNGGKYAWAQPTGCFEVESFLADACGGTEGLNEMVRIQIGPNPQNLSDLVVDWPNISNPWLGYCQNATTAALTAQINASITGCGQVIEPLNGILPAGVTVILFTSEFFNPATNPFTNLNETVYVVYQCGNETAGNFANTGANPRTLTIGFGSLTGPCSQAVTYIPDNLVGGDGATVQVDASGGITYDNSGCQGLLVDLDPTWAPPSSICSSEPPFDLNDYVTGTPGGTFSGSGVINDIFDPSGLSGAINITYTLTPTGCATPVSEMHTITVNLGGDASWTSPGTLCESSGTFDLSTVLSGSTGGTWSGTGVTGNTFDPSGLSGAITITYAVGTGACTDSENHTITVQSSADASWNGTTVCETGPVLDLTTLLTGSTGGTWSGTGVSGSNFNPSGLNGAITLTYTVGSGVCADSESHDITVVTQPSAAWTPPTGICENAAALNLTTLLTGQTGGTWTGSGVSGTSFNPSGLNGAIAVTYAVGSGSCAASETHNIPVIAVPSATWTPNPANICSNAAPVDLSTMLSGTTGGNWTGSGVSATQFDPNGLNGSVSISYSVVQNGCTSTESHAIMVLVQPSASWNIPAPICATAGNENMSPWIAGTTGGTWSGNGVNGNQFDPSGLSGSVTLTYTVGPAGCQNSETHDVTVLAPMPLVTVSGTTSFCANQNPSELTATGTGGTIQWFGDAGLQLILNTGSTFTPPATPVAVTIYVNQTDGVCPSAGTPVTLTPIPVPALPITDTLVTWCQGDALPLLQAFSNDALRWYAEDACINPLGNGPSLQVNPGMTAVYLRAENGTCVSDVEEVLLLELPKVTATILGDEVIYACLPKSLQLQSADSFGNLWSTGEIGPSIWVSKPGMIYLQRSGSCNSAIDSIKVEDVSFYTRFSLGNTEGFAPLPVSATNLTQNAETCTWYLNGVETEPNSEGTLLFPQDTTYRVRLECENAYGCKSHQEQMVNIGFVQLLVPNTFSPNNDGVNDVYGPSMNGIINLDLTIFDRWGNEVFHAEGLDSGWAGTLSNGETAAEGVYVALIHAQDKNYKHYTLREGVLLIR